MVDYGLQDRWTGAADGTREVTRRVVVKSLDWTDLRVLDPARGMLAQANEALMLIREGLPAETPFIQTLHSPLAQARMLAGTETLLKHMRVSPERLKTGLTTLAESTIRYAESLRRSGVAGVYYVIDLASYAHLSEAEYMEFGRPFDLRVLSALNRDWWLNIAYIGGPLPILGLTADYPVRAIGWNDRDSEPDIAAMRVRIPQAVCGGYGALNALALSSPAEVRSQARSALEMMNGRRLILASGGPVWVTTPLANLQAARQVVELKV